MDKAQPPGVEALACQAGHRLFCPIHRIAQQGMAQIGHVDANLVGAAGLQTALQVGAAGIAPQHLPVGHRRTALGVHRHLLPVHRVAADGGVHRAAVLFEAAHRHRLVHPGQGVVLKLGGQSQMGAVVFGRDNKAGGVPVNAVDNARAQLPVDA